MKASIKFTLLRNDYWEVAFALRDELKRHRELINSWGEGCEHSLQMFIDKHNRLLKILKRLIKQAELETAFEKDAELILTKINAPC